MLNSTYAPQRWSDLEVSKVRTMLIGTQDTAVKNTTTTFDILISDDAFFRELKFVTKNAVFGDKFTMQLVDKDGVMFAPGTVITTPIADYNMVEDTQIQTKYESVVPFKIPGLFYFRFIYTSTGNTTDVSVGINLLMIKILL